MTQPLRPADLALKGATVLPLAEGAAALSPCDIVVTGGRIVALGRGAAGGYAADTVLAGDDLLVVPGLVNGHTHSPETLARGVADGKALGDWLAAVWTELDALSPEAIGEAVLLAAAEMLHGGVTAVVDHFRQTPMRDDALEAAVGAWSRTGMRARLAVMVRDVGVPAWAGRGEDARAQIDRVVRFADATRRAGGRVDIAYGPSAPTRCSGVLLAAVPQLFAGHGVRTQMHVDETRHEVALAGARFGRTSVAELDAVGALGPHVSLAHCVWCDDDDLDRLAASGTAVVHNPVANLRLGSGRAPLARMRRRGIPVVVATDGAASNDGQNVLEAAKVAALLSRLEPDPADHLSAADALAAVTRVAGGAFGLSPGVLAPGAPADFAAFDLTEPALAPAHDLAAQLVLAGAGLRARHVAVGGDLLVRDHAITSFDEAAVRARARARFRR